MLEAVCPVMRNPACMYAQVRQALCVQQAMASTCKVETWVQQSEAMLQGLLSCRPTTCTSEHVEASGCYAQLARQQDLPSEPREGGRQLLPPDRPGPAGSA